MAPLKVHYSNSFFLLAQSVTLPLFISSKSIGKSSQVYTQAKKSWICWDLNHQPPNLIHDVLNLLTCYCLQYSAAQKSFKLPQVQGAYKFLDCAQQSFKARFHTLQSRAVVTPGYHNLSFLSSINGHWFKTFLKCSTFDVFSQLKYLQ